EMRTFFYNHIDFITEESVVPDIRKYTINDKMEFARHYIDIEDFDIAVEDFPKTMKEAIVKFDSAFLQKNGMLPWYIQTITDKLTKSFKNKNKTEILFLAADLGHYIADAHMPLHTSSNHDGQVTNQKGIHSFWESQLPELFGDTYNFYIGKARFINNITDETWRIIKHSNQLADTLLLTEKKVHESFPKEKIYKTDSNKNILKNQYSQPVHTVEYAKKYHSALKGMVENQMRSAIMATANYWYTAWVNAGKPDLTSLDSEDLTNRNEKHLKEDMKAWTKGKITNLKIQSEQ
ncbi:MAG: zinc dependent phospholipase C family protein, partial [Ginsengibacter sp.]